MLNKELKLFYFIKKFSKEHFKSILKYKNLNIIYIFSNDYPVNEIINLRNICKKHKIRFYFSSNSKIINYLKPDGIHISSKNKAKIFNIKKNIDIIGTAHNQLDYYKKINQGCSSIFLSPLFYTSKYSNNRKLGIVKFNLLTKNWKTKVLALGGIRKENIKKIKLTMCIGFGGISFFEK